MKIDSKLTDHELLKLIGQRLADLRLARNLTQQQLAEQAGLGLRTVQRLEQGLAATQLSGFVRVSRAGIGRAFRSTASGAGCKPDGTAEIAGAEAPARERQERRTQATEGMDLG